MANEPKVTLVALDPEREYFLGLVEKEGDYDITDEKTGKRNQGHYHNIIVSLGQPYEFNEKNVIGSVGVECNTYKLKAENAPYVFGERPDTFNPSVYSSWFGQPVIVLYDKKGNLKSLKLDNTAPKTVGKIES